MELKTPLTADAYCVYDADGAILISDEDYGEGEREVLAELVRRANAHDQLVAALHTIAYEPIGYADSSHRDVLDRITEIARDALAAAKGGS